MAALTCELCGGKLIGKPGGIFECDSCGMEYDTAWAKEKIQEIKGTVKVEGTVEVTGKVQLDGAVTVDASGNVEALLKRGNMALLDEKYQEAKDFFNRVLDIDAENGDAHLGVILAKFRYNDPSALVEQYAAELKKPKKDKQFFKELEWVRKYGSAEVKAAFDAQDDARAQYLHERAAKAAERKDVLHKRREEIAPAAEMLIASNWFDAVALKADGTVLVERSPSDYHFASIDRKSWQNVRSIHIGYGHLIGLREDGTVVANGLNNQGQCNVEGPRWKNIVAIATGGTHTVGLRNDGTVVATGDNDDGACDVEQWHDVVAVFADYGVTFGLKADGTVESTCEIRPSGNPLTNVVKLYPFGYERVVGVRADGTVAGCEEAKDWTDIIDIAPIRPAGGDYFIAAGLRADGTVISERFSVEEWTDIVAIKAGKRQYGSCLVGLRADGTVISTAHNSSSIGQWTDIVAIAVGEDYDLLGIRADGTVLHSDAKKQELVSGWKLFESIETLEQERAEIAAQRAEKERLEAERKRDESAQCEKSKRLQAEWRAEKLRTEKTELTAELSNLKGIFSGKRRKEIEARLIEINNELSKL